MKELVEAEGDEKEKRWMLREKKSGLKASIWQTLTTLSISHLYPSLPPCTSGDREQIQQRTVDLSAIKTIRSHITFSSLPISIVRHFLTLERRHLLRLRVPRIRRDKERSKISAKTP
jgi:hypothetical protein